MQVVYYNEEMPYKFSKSIFLCGPTLRSGQEGESWRKDALQILSDIGFDGVIFIPENRNGRLEEEFDHNDTVNWEQKHLDLADVILAWIPRTEELPGYTTNIEFGAYKDSGRIVLGWPEDALKMRYIEHCADQLNIPIHHSLTETIETALEIIGEGAERTLGERYIPLNIWRLPTFQNWYRSLMNAGNRLETCQSVLSIPTPKNPSAAIWIIRPNIYVASEDRFKSNEIVLGRPDISSVCMYKRTDDDVEIVLVKEFRSSVANKNGFVYELPSGGHLTNKSKSIKETAISEVYEEVGLTLDEERLTFKETRQLAGTMMSHKSNLFSYELNNEELSWLKSQKGIHKGLKEEGEITTIEIVSLTDLKKNNFVDWTNLGQILLILQQE